MKYDFKKIEQKWQEAWQKERVYEPDLDKATKPFYNLMMFPYPSAEGLHVGNVYAFTGSDIYGRFKRMQGYDVFEPIGLDGFGIHSENYALKIGVHPMEQAKASEKRFYKQLEIIGNGFAWEERLETYNPKYYRWTQWLFTQLFNNGLAYRRKAPVNWCPSCKTVLADEQVIQNECERCKNAVERKELEQWFFKTTEYADQLLKKLDEIDWSERVKIAQRNWIGRSEGAEIKFEIVSKTNPPAGGLKPKTFVEVFTTRPDTLFGATYMVFAPEHELIRQLKGSNENWSEVSAYIKQARSKTEQERIEEGNPSTGLGRGKTGVELKGIFAVNPATKEEIPIWVADYVLASYGTGAIMAVPAHDERDFIFAKKFNLPIKQVISQEELINSGKFNGTPAEKARWDITNFVGGKRQIQYRLRDWLISRQRYWGAPIPMIFCEACAEKIKGAHQQVLRPRAQDRGARGEFTKGELKNPGWFAVPENKLPVELPYIDEFRPTGTDKSPLAIVESFYKTTCPKCGGEARRETDVSDTFLDSAWYYLRYIDVNNNKKPFDKSRAKKWLPVDMYIGGPEHSVLHLLYTRFITKALHDFGHLEFDEPFTKFRAHGLIIKEGAKMSKSRGNVVNPDEYIEKFGADALRMYLMFLAPLEQGGDFRDAGILGITRFLEKAWKLFQRDTNMRIHANDTNNKLRKILHQSIKKVTEDIETLKYNTAISQLMILLNEIEKSGELSHATAGTFLKLLAPFAPHITEELWHEALGNITSIHTESWPKYDSKLIEEENFELIVQVNGKVRDTIILPRGTAEAMVVEAAHGSAQVVKYFADKKIKKTIFVKDKLINFVV